MRPQPIRLLALFALAAALAGCVSASSAALGGGEAAYAWRERGLDPATIIIPHQLTDEMKAWAHEMVPRATAPEQRLTVLLAALQDPKRLGLTYVPNHTGTAREAFESKKANCLAFTSLFVGMAREVGLPAFYLDVDDILKFSKEGDLVVVSGHVTAGFDVGPDIKILDFAAAPEIEYRSVRPINDLTATALFYSNRGAELLRAGDHEGAREWLKTAVILDPELASAWTNYGVALRRAGDPEGAERAYRMALEVDPRAVSAYQNLAALLRRQGRESEALQLLALVEQLGSRNPFSYLNLGDISMSHGRLDEARRLFKKALRLYRESPEPYAAMGQVALAAGDRGNAMRWLRKAQAIDGENERVRALAARLTGPVPVGATAASPGSRG